MLRSIERATGQVIELMELPSHEAINTVRVQRFFAALTRTLAEEDLADLVALMERYQQEHGVDPLLMAAALAHHTKGGSPLLLKPRQTERAARTRDEQPPKGETQRRPGKGRSNAEPAPGAERPRRKFDDGGDFDTGAKRPPRRPRPGDEDLEVFRIEVGRAHGVEPRNILGAIANEAGLEARHIGRIELFDDHSTVELPPGMPKPVFEHLKRVWVSGQQLRISRVGDGAEPSPRRRKPAPKEYPKSRSGEGRKATAPAKGRRPKG